MSSKGEKIRDGDKNDDGHADNGVTWVSKSDDRDDRDDRGRGEHRHDGDDHDEGDRGQGRDRGDDKGDDKDDKKDRRDHRAERDEDRDGRDGHEHGDKDVDDEGSEARAKKDKDKDKQDRLAAAEKAAEEQAEAVKKAAAEKAAAEKAAAEKAAAEKAAAEKAAAEKAAAEKAAAEKAAAEKAAAEKAAAEKAAAEKVAAEAAAAEKTVAEKAGLDIHIGDGLLNGLAGWDNSNSIVFGEGGDDKLVGLGGDDRMHGGGGNDTMSGDDGNDLMFGASTVGGKVDMSKFKISEDATAKVTFDYESAGYKNALGVYKIGPDGAIAGVQILFANASLKGSGGDLVAGKSSVDVPVKAGEQLGFFVVPDGFSQRGMATLLSDKSATYKFVGADGKAGNINAGSELKLVQVSAAGVETVVKSAYGTTVFHSVDTGALGLNGDGMKHVTGTVNNIDGTVKVGFEDLKWGGDKDFDDSVFTVSLGATNTALLAKEATSLPWLAKQLQDCAAGSPTVIARLTLPGDTSQVAARLLDVDAGGEEPRQQRFGCGYDSGVFPPVTFSA